MEIRPKKRILGKARITLGKGLKDDYEKGASIRDLAAAIGRSYGFVHSVLGEAGAALRGRGGARSNRDRAES